MRAKVAGALLVLLVLAACEPTKGSPPNPIWAQVCVDQATKSVDVYTRLPDSSCETRVKNATWRFYRKNDEIAAVGMGVGRRAGTWTQPAGADLVRIPAAGGRAIEEWNKK
jgi:hypothetical protein